MKRFPSLVVVPGLICIGWLGLYFLCGSFGIYEDDYFFTLSAYQWTGDQLWDNLRVTWTSWPQFRPLGFSLSHLLSYVSAQFDSLVPGYLFGLALHVVNGWLLFRIASIRLRPAVAFVAAAIFMLYPSDTGKTILMLRVFQVFNLTMVLSAILLYLRGRRVCSYVVAAGCLLVYEHFFLAFFIAPFILGLPRPLPYRRFALHFALCAALPASLMVVRKIVGDPRSGAVLASPGETLDRMLHACLIGPRTALTAMVERPWDAFWHSDALQWGVIIVVGIVVVVVIRQLRAQTGAGPASPAESPQLYPLRDVILLAVGGALCFAGSYVLAILDDNFPPIVNVGRLSGFNAPGSVSCCLMIAAVLELTIRCFPRVQTFVVASGAIYIGLLTSFGLEIQRTDYVRHWQQQKNLWDTVFASSGEWRPGVPVIIDVRNANAPDYYTRGFPFYWTIVSSPLVTPHFLAPEVWQCFTASPASAPRIYGYYPEMGATLVEKGLRLHTPPWSGSDLWPVIRSNQFILFHFEAGKLVRTSSPLTLPQGVFTPLPPPLSPPSQLPFSRLHHILFNTPIEWPSLARSHNYPR